jgi:translation initiation factor IF-3
MRDNKTNNRFVRVNFNITAPQVRLSADDGTSEIVTIAEARARAAAEELDLVEVVANAKPPVVKIMDFGKWRYEEKIRRKDDMKKQKTVAPKEIQLRYCIGQNDIDTKVRSLKKFLEEKRQVRLVVKFKHRELAYVSQGEAVLRQMAEAVTELGELQNKPKLEGKSLIANVMPK